MGQLHGCLPVRQNGSNGRFFVWFLFGNMQDIIAICIHGLGIPDDARISIMLLSIPASPPKIYLTTLFSDLRHHAASPQKGLYRVGCSVSDSMIITYLPSRGTTDWQGSSPLCLTLQAFERLWKNPVQSVLDPLHIA